MQGPSSARRGDQEMTTTALAVRRGSAISSGAEAVEAVRRTVNQTFSEVPQELDSVFRAALDQVSDQQYNVSALLTALLEAEGGSSDSVTETAVAAAVSEAQRAGLRACRAYADLEFQLAVERETEILRVPVNVAELTREKQGIDKRFAEAAALHEKNDIAALDRLISAATDYKEWCSKAQATVSGTRALAASDRLKTRLTAFGIFVAIAIGVVNYIKLWFQ